MLSIKAAISHEGMAENYIKAKYNMVIEEVITIPKQSFSNNDVIAVGGVMRRIETTTVTLNMCEYLNSLGASVCYFEGNTSGHLDLIADDKNMIKGEYRYTHNGIDYLNYNDPISKEYNYIVCRFRCYK